jgi:hypothetical protein
MTLSRSIHCLRRCLCLSSRSDPGTAQGRRYVQWAVLMASRGRRVSLPRFIWERDGLSIPPGEPARVVSFSAKDMTCSLRCATFLNPCPLFGPGFRRCDGFGENGSIAGDQLATRDERTGGDRLEKLQGELRRSCAEGGRRISLLGGQGLRNGVINHKLQVRHGLRHLCNKRVDQRHYVFTLGATDLSRNGRFCRQPVTAPATHFLEPRV